MPDWFPDSVLPRIRGRRVVLRELADSDADALVAIFSNPDVTRYWGGPGLTDRAAARRQIAKIQRGLETGTFLQWGVTLPREERVIGTCTLWQLDAGNRRSEIGFALHRDHWGQGLMRDALTALLEFAFVGLDLHRLEADVDPRNVASLALLERLGFQREGYLRERWQEPDGAADSVFLGLLAREWQERSWAE